MEGLWKAARISDSFNFDEWRSTQPGELCCCLQQRHLNARRFCSARLSLSLSQMIIIGSLGFWGRKTELTTDGNLFVLPVLALDAGGGTDQVLDHVVIDGQRESCGHAARRGNLKPYLMGLMVTRQTILE